MKKDDFAEQIGNERYEGLCKDLADSLKTRLGFNCKYTEFEYLMRAVYLCLPLPSIVNLLFQF